MNIITLLLLFINYFIFTFGENNNYIVSIRRSVKDKEYDNADVEVQRAIDELVNDRMNDIYEIISKNVHTYGKQDEKLNELKKVGLMKRDLHQNLRFKNKNRIQSYHNYIKRSSNSTETEIEIESELVSHICPILNYYAIKAYLSDDIVEKVKKLPNVVRCEKSYSSENSVQKTYYDLNNIKKETKWSDVNVQENDSDDSNFFSHLSLISQGRFYGNQTYDNNFYYPSSAGKGIDIFIIDNGLYTNAEYEADHIDFDTSDNERTITCDVIIRDGTEYEVSDNKRCTIYDNEYTREVYQHYDTYPEHGVMVTSVAGGNVNGVAKKANIHMVASEFENLDELYAFDYIKQHGKPYKTVISISRNGNCPYSIDLQNKLYELTNNGYIVVVSAGNKSQNACGISDDNNINLYAGYENVITVGATENYLYNNILNGYRAASYSNFGGCVDIYGPGEVICANTNFGIDSYFDFHGTSCATPIVAGVVATIMSEHPNVKYTYESMKKELLNLSLKDVLENLGSSDTPNRFINNGKHSVYRPRKCNDPSGEFKCDTGCCSFDGKCIEYSDIPDSDETPDFCFIDRNCNSEFSRCLPSDPNTAGLTEVERRKIVINNCYEELLPFDECQSEIVDTYLMGTRPLNELTEECDLYRDTKCKEFYKSPFDFAPSCLEAVNYREYDVLREENSRFNSVIHDLYCSREMKNGSYTMCSLSKKLYFNQFKKKSDISKAILSNCGISECHESFLKYNEYLLDLYSKDDEVSYRDSYSDVKERMSLLLSDKCIAAQSNSSKTTTTTTTITKSKTTSKTTTTEAIPTSTNTKTTKKTTIKTSTTKKTTSKKTTKITTTKENTTKKTTKITTTKKSTNKKTTKITTTKKSTNKKTTKITTTKKSTTKKSTTKNNTTKNNTTKNNTTKKSTTKKTTKKTTSKKANTKKTLKKLHQKKQILNNTIQYSKLNINFYQSHKKKKKNFLMIVMNKIM
eukprot:jgi/Orpsp1_1/1189284/evm.model.d7180000070872.1